MPETDPFSTTYRETAGDSIFFALTLLTDKAGEPVTSLDGYTFRFTAKLDPADADEDALVRKSSLSGGGIEKVATQARWKLTPAESAELPAGRHIYFDVQATDAAGDVKTLRKAYLFLEPEITKTTP